MPAVTACYLCSLPVCGVHCARAKMCSQACLLHAVPVLTEVHCWLSSFCVLLSPPLCPGLLLFVSLAAEAPSEVPAKAAGTGSGAARGHRASGAGGATSTAGHATQDAHVGAAALAAATHDGGDQLSSSAAGRMAECGRSSGGDSGSGGDGSTVTRPGVMCRVIAGYHSIVRTHGSGWGLPHSRGRPLQALDCLTLGGGVSGQEEQCVLCCSALTLTVVHTDTQ